MIYFNTKSTTTFALAVCFATAVLPNKALAMNEEEVSKPLSHAGVSKRKPRCRREELKENLRLEDYPVETSDLEEALTTATDIFSQSLEQINFMDSLLEEVKRTKPEDGQMGLYQTYFGRVALLPGVKEKGDRFQFEAISSFHENIKGGLTTYIEGFIEFKKKCELGQSSGFERKTEVNRVIKGLDLWISEENGFGKTLKEMENTLRKRHSRSRGKNKNRRYIDLLREDHLIDTLQDQLVLWSKVREMFVPYASDSRIEVTEIEEDETSLREKEIKAEKRRTKNRKRKERERRRKQALLKEKEDKAAEAANCKQASVLEIHEKKSEEPEEKEVPSSALLTEEVEKGSTEDDHTKFTRPLIKRLPLSAVERDEDSIDVKKTSPHEMNRSPRPVPTWAHKVFKKKGEKKSSKLSGLKVSKRNITILNSIFQEPVSTDISMDAFDNLVKSPAGFCGRVYGGKRSHIYEVYVSLNTEGIPSHFLNFLDFQKQKKSGLNVAKHRFSLHRPHVRGKNKQGKSRNMYPALVELARKHLQRFNLTPEEIISF